MTKQTRQQIGTISWYGTWRKYCLWPEPDTVFEQVCLRDIAAFCEQQTKLHLLEKRETAIHQGRASAPVDRGA
jgi:hypothetical protein